ncbi:carboxylesterase 5A isoform X2 [Phyllostomus hastatus]|uniref:carboxylesterase 5A isoform X2 n=1 Tax=Phyllostomus hastatus TaxID=9423 RepID=UPI001E681464|nr:carboxylesterase 5A isoform X2 [Phyllostomus hastatus]XP_045674649.1 carboxylesterase 5A isoform X2 [Phyllostomus hastatus]XP_045674650.1 carboxylesterase 5A isoform X2 [Phyllostomus hastatus]
MSGEWAHPGQTLIWAVWVLAAATEGPAGEAPVRNTRLGWVRGKQAAVLGSTIPVNVFLGVPFAAPPLGPLRFANPEPMLPWNGFRDATSYPKMCLQNSDWLPSYEHILRVHFPNSGVSEDCLYLNIYAPAHTDTGAKLPVMVWLPGGAFQTGSASMFDGSALAAYEDVLVVTTQYRLGMFGFFNTGDQHAPGNWAFMDQLAALTWVQENIEFFGGDPRSVTIFGESAGAISVSSLVLSPLANELFHKAIMQSGVAIIPFLQAPDEERDEDLQMIADTCGCEAADSQALLQCLRAKPSEELLNISEKTKSFTRVVDGLFLPDEPLELLIQKTFNSVPAIIGVNNHECGFLLPVQEFPEVLRGSNKSVILRMLHTALNIPTQYLSFVADEYFPDELSLLELRNSFLDLLGDVFFVVPGLVTAQYHRDVGTPVYFYEFQHRPHCLRDRKPAFVRADHTDEIRFVFGGAFLKGDVVMFEGATEEEALLSRKMMRYWANFARTGDPNGEGLPLWPAYSQKEQYLQLDLNLSVGQRLKAQKVEFWTETLPLMVSTSGGHLGPPSSLLFLSLLLPFMLPLAC